MISHWKKPMYMKLAVGSALIIAVISLCWGPISNHLDKRSLEGLEVKRVDAAELTSKLALQARVDRLYADRCESVAMKVLAGNQVKPVTSALDIDPEILSDIRLCDQRKIMSPIVRDQLRDKGLLAFIPLT